ncbi:MAG: Bax inhibitor-1/YccA family protein [Flavobacteriales bacterium]|nr:Bax inhibitor-1/YccA family protein [Flavobacteriales bacterium]
MNFTQSSNPILTEKRFKDVAIKGELMTMNGTINKIGIMGLLVLAGAYFTWDLVSATEGIPFGWVAGGGIGGFIVAIIISFKPNLAPLLAPIYALLEGLFLGAISAGFEMIYPGIVLNAVGLTFAILFSLLFLYKAKIIRVTEKFKSIAMIGIMGLMAFYLVSFMMSMFGGGGFSVINSSSPIGIGFSLVVVALASMFLLMDFDFIEKSVERKAPKFMEWYAAFGLMVTLIWLYMEILRLLSKLRR